LSQHLEAIHPWQHHIEHEKIVPLQLRFSQGDLTVVDHDGLMASFGLEADPALLRVAAIVHHLDVGGEPVPEAAGFEAVMTGARERLEDDGALLTEMSSVLDSLHAHFQRAAAPSKP